VPNLLQIPTGCVFAPRCPKAFDRCRREQPIDHAVGATQSLVSECNSTVTKPVKLVTVSTWGLRFWIWTTTRLVKAGRAALRLTRGGWHRHHNFAVGPSNAHYDALTKATARRVSAALEQVITNCYEPKNAGSAHDPTHVAHRFAFARCRSFVSHAGNHDLV